MSKEKIVERWIDGQKAYFFRYNATEEVGFEFSLLCEVGQPFIPTFERMIAEAGLDLVTMEINEKPWVITVDRPAGVKKTTAHLPMGGWNPKKETK